jgi:hypothetical protein
MDTVSSFADLDGRGDDDSEGASCSTFAEEIAFSLACDCAK